MFTHKSLRKKNILFGLGKKDNNILWIVICLHKKWSFYTGHKQYYFFEKFMCEHVLIYMWNFCFNFFDILKCIFWQWVRLLTWTELDIPFTPSIPIGSPFSCFFFYQEFIHIHIKIVGTLKCFNMNPTIIITHNIIKILINFFVQSSWNTWYALFINTEVVLVSFLGFYCSCHYD
jgi:hypothetical protein